MKTITLKSRVIILLTTFTVLLISIFISIQLVRELDTVNKFNSSRSAMVSLILQNTWEKIDAFNLTEDRKIEFLSRKLNTLKEAKEIENAYVLDKEAKIVFATEKKLEGQTGDFGDRQVAGDSEKASSETIIDKRLGLFSIYVPLKSKDNNVFAARLFFSLANLGDAYAQVYKPAFMIGVLIVFVNIILGFFLSRLIIGPINVFNKAAKIIASGRLDLRVNIATNDELEELANTFNFMTEELVKMKEKAENANPLTKLPGNIVIHEEIDKRINGNMKFTVVYCDLDNFKAFNDKYGIAKGDDAIKLTGQIFKDAIENKGNPDDFIGHEGGDDFLLLTTPEKAQSVADYITSEFDKRVRSLYNEEDLGRGFIVAHGRDGAVHEFPIMTISLAGVTNEHRPISSYAEVTNIAAEIKKKAKKIAKSCFVLDQRKDV